MTSPRNHRSNRAHRTTRAATPTLAVTCPAGIHGTTAARPDQVTFIRRTPQDPPATWTVVTYCPGCGTDLLAFRPPRNGDPAVTPLTAVYARLAAAGAHVIDVPPGPARAADVIPLVLPGGAA